MQFLYFILHAGIHALDKDNQFILYLLQIYTEPLFLCQSLQMVSGILSVGLGIIFAATQTMGDSLFTLFRVSQLTGTLVSPHYLNYTINYSNERM